MWDSSKNITSRFSVTKKKMKVCQATTHVGHQSLLKMSRVMRNPAVVVVCICENAARYHDQRLCFFLIDSSIPLLPQF